MRLKHLDCCCWSELQFEETKKATHHHFFIKRQTTMDRTASLDTEDIRKVTVDMVHPLIATFFNRITSQQWAALLSGQPDDDTQQMLGELLFNIEVLIFKSVLVAMKEEKDKDLVAEVVTSLGDSIPPTFAEVLHAEEVSCESSDSLKSLVVEDVVDSIKSTIETPKETPRHKTFAHRLDTKVHHMTKMIGTFVEGNLKRCRARTPTRSQSDVPEVSSTEIIHHLPKPLAKVSPAVLVSVSQEQFTSSPLMVKGSKEGAAPVKSSKSKGHLSLISRISRFFKKRRTDTVAPAAVAMAPAPSSYVQDVPDKTIALFNIVQQQSPKDTCEETVQSQQQSPDVTCEETVQSQQHSPDVTCEETVQSQQHSPEVTCEETVQSQQHSPDVTFDSIPPTFAEVLHAEEVSCESSDSQKSLVVEDVVDSIKSTIETPKETPRHKTFAHRLDTTVHHMTKMIGTFVKGNLKRFRARTPTRSQSDVPEVSSTEIIHHLPKPPAKVSPAVPVSVSQEQFTSSPLVVKGSKEGAAPVKSSKSKGNLSLISRISSVFKKRRTDTVAPAAVAVAPAPSSGVQDVPDKTIALFNIVHLPSPDVTCEETAMSQRQSPEVTGITSVDISARSVAACTSEEKPNQVTSTTTELCVSALIEAVILQTTRGANANLSSEEFDTLNKDLFEKVWAAVKDDVIIAPEKSKMLDKAIFKDLCRQWGTPTLALTFLHSGPPIADQMNVSCFKKHLRIAPKKPGAFRNFVSSLRETVSKHFRRVDSEGVELQPSS